MERRKTQSCKSNKIETDLRIIYSIFPIKYLRIDILMITDLQIPSIETSNLEFKFSTAQNTRIIINNATMIIIWFLLFMMKFEVEKFVQI